MRPERISPFARTYSSFVDTDIGFGDLFQGRDACNNRSWKAAATPVRVSCLILLLCLNAPRTARDFRKQDSSHFEVIELLRKADRPLTLRLRRVGGERLLRRRAEMRALTQPQGVLATGRAELESRNSPNRAGVGAGPRDGEGNATGGSSFRAGKSSANVQIPRLPASPLPVRVLRRQDSLPVGFGLQEDSPGSCQGGKDGANTSIGEASDGAEEADGARGRPETPFTFPEAENGDGLSPEQGSASGVTPAASSAVPTETAPPLAPEHVVWKWKPGGDAEVGLDGGGVARGHLSGGMASAAAGMTANWEAVEWAESCLLAVSEGCCNAAYVA